MANKPAPSDLERAEWHAQKAERLLKSWWISSHVKAEAHAALALYYVSHDARSS